MDNGIILLNKPADKSSNYVINQIKYRLRDKGFDVKKIGHAGTLDPNAKGLLVVLLNDATKISDYLMLKDKEYIAEICLGKSFDTLDIWGTLEEEKALNEKDLDNVNVHIDEVLNSMLGKSMQIPPMYSSLKLNGRKLYDIARNGETVDISDKVREIEVFKLERISDIKLENSEIRFGVICHVSKGTYIRSLAKTIGEKLGYPSCMSDLTRTKSGCFDLKNAYTLDEIILGKYQLVNMLDAIDSIEEYKLNDKEYDRALHGTNMKIHKDASILKLSYNNNLIAIYERIGNNFYKAKRVWN